MPDREARLALRIDETEEIEAALARYTGTLIVVTHDRLLRERFHGHRLQLPVAAEKTRQNCGP